MAETPGKMYALATVLTLLATSAVGLRFKARHIRKADLAWDDYTIALALLFTIGTAICMFVGTSLGGLGRHTMFKPNGKPILDERVKIFQQVSYASNLTATLTFGLTKISVLLLYKRIFRGTAKARLFVATVWVLIAIVAIWTISFFFSNLFQCHPISINWTGLGGSSATCVDEATMYIAQAFSDVFTDLLILLLPIPCVWALQLPIKQKLAVCSMFLLGALTIAASVTKLVFFYSIATESTTGHNLDFTYLFTPTIYWPMVESSLGIVGACLPLLKPIVSDIPAIQSFRSMLSSRSTSKASSQNALKDSKMMEEGMSMSKSTLASSDVSTFTTAKSSLSATSTEIGSEKSKLPVGKYTVMKVGRIHLMREQREDRCSSCGRCG